MALSLSEKQTLNDLREIWESTSSEDDLARDYADFELGAVPPFSGREDPVIVDERLATRDSVVLEAGAHDRSVRLKAADLVRLTKAQVADICREEPTAG